MLKITMLGTTGAGKSTYMTGLYETLGREHIDDFKLVSKADTFEEVVHPGSPQLRGQSFADLDFEFPDPTLREIQSWQLTLRRQARKALDIEWIDYKGGMINEFFKEKSADEKAVGENTLIQHIKSSHAVMVLCDAITIAHNSTRKALRLTGGQEITDTLDGFGEKFPNTPLSVVVVLTKCDSDLLEPEMVDDDFAVLREKAGDVLSGLRKICTFKKRLWKAGLVPIGCVGMGNVTSTLTKAETLKTPDHVKTKISGEPEPFNTELPLFFSVGSYLDLYSRFLIARKQRNHEEFERLMESSSKLDDILSLITFKKGKQAQANEIDEECKQLEKRIASMRNLFKPLTNAAEQGVAPFYAD